MQLTQHAKDFLVSTAIIAAFLVGMEMVLPAQRGPVAADQAKEDVIVPPEVVQQIVQTGTELQGAQMVLDAATGVRNNLQMDLQHLMQPWCQMKKLQDCIIGHDGSIHAPTTNNGRGGAVVQPAEVKK